MQQLDPSDNMQATVVTSVCYDMLIQGPPQQFAISHI